VTATAPARTKLTLAAIQKGKLAAPPRILIYGPEGIGKTRLASECDGALLLDLEKGSAERDVARVKITRYDEVLDIVEALRHEQHEHRVLAIDTVTRLEGLVFDRICERTGKPSIEDVGGGYGKGYVAAADEFRLLFARLDELREQRNMAILLLGHSVVREFKNPEGENYDRYSLRMNEKNLSPLVREWCDLVGFATFDTVVKKGKGAMTGDRLIYTQRTAAFDAKSRYDLPAEIPLSWAEFSKALRAARAQKEAAK